MAPGVWPVFVLYGATDLLFQYGIIFLFFFNFGKQLFFVALTSSSLFPLAGTQRSVLCLLSGMKQVAPNKKRKGGQ